MNKLPVLPTYFDEPFEPDVHCVFADGKFGVTSHSPNVEDVLSTDFNVLTIASLPNASNFRQADMNSNFDKLDSTLGNLASQIDGEVIVPETPGDSVNN